MSSKYSKVVQEVCNDARAYFALNDQQIERLQANFLTDMGRLDSVPVKEVKLGKLNKDGQLKTMRAINEALKNVNLTNSLCVFKLVVGIKELIPFGISFPVPLAKGLVEWLNKKPAPASQEGNTNEVPSQEPVLAQ